MSGTRLSLRLLAKTGIRRKELITLDVDDIDWVDRSEYKTQTNAKENKPDSVL